MPVFAHETWFADGGRTDWGFAGETETLILLALALIATVALRLIARVWNGVDVPAIARLVPFIPFAVRIRLAVALIGLASMGVFLSPAMDLPTTLFGVFLGVLMVVIAIAMVAGFR